MSSKAEQILAGLGGADNVVEIEACITRLRTEVKDGSLVDQAALKAAGDPMITWDPSSLPTSAAGQDVSPVVPVVLMDGVKGSVTSEAIGASVAAGELLFVAP